MKRNKLIVFSAPSGAGKTTLVKHILSQFSNTNFSISATSRSPRGNEKDGIDYHFLSNNEFKKNRKKRKDKSIFYRNPPPFVIKKKCFIMKPSNIIIII